jgi:hypothetical protein
VRIGDSVEDLSSNVDQIAFGQLFTLLFVQELVESLALAIFKDEVSLKQG